MALKEAMEQIIKLRYLGKCLNSLSEDEILELAC